MYFLTLNIFLLVGHITAETNKTTNVTSFLPYTLKANLNRDINKAVQSNDRDEVDKYTVHDTVEVLNFYEKQGSGDARITPVPHNNNNWKRLATYFPTQAPSTVSNQQDLTYAADHFDYNNCNNRNLYSKHISSIPTAFISQPILLFIHLGILLYTLFGVVVLFNRLLYFTQSHNLFAVNQGHIYKTDF